MNEEEKISIVIQSFDDSIICPIICEIDEKFSSIENKFYEIYPECKKLGKKLIFKLKEKTINPLKTLNENKIRNNDLISFVIRK